MDCQHCGEYFPDISNFETHCKWHSERQALLRRPKQRQYRDSVHSEAESISSPTASTFSASSNQFSDNASPAELEPFSSKSGPLEVTLGPSFQFLALEVPQTKTDTLSNVHEEEPAGIHTVLDVLKKFPEYNPDESGHGKDSAPDLECPDCHAVFFSRKDCLDHQQSSSCPDSAAVAYVMIGDPAQPGGYRVERRLLSFDVSRSRIKCTKCKQSFANQLGLEAHQASHVLENLECVHCQRLFHTVTELEYHYDWHDDMEFRHHRDRLRAKQPGLKLQSELGYRDQTKVAVPNFKRQSVLSNSARPMPIIHEAASIVSGEAGITNDYFNVESRINTASVVNSQSDDDFIAISFISAEDLERTHAPNGIFRNPEVEELPSETAASVPQTPRSTEQSDTRLASHEVASLPSLRSLDTRLEANLRPDSPSSYKRASSIRNMFRRSMAVTPPSSSPGSPSPKKTGSLNGHSRQFSTESNQSSSDFAILSAILERIKDSASKGDLAAVKRESERFFQAPPSHFRPPKQHHVRIHASSSQEGVFVTDARGVTRVLNDEAKEELTSGIRNMPNQSWARAKVRILSTRADLSSEKEDLADALWCYQELLDFVKKFPAIFPAPIWHAAILSNLGDIAEQMHHPQVAEAYYLQALNASYSHQGRYDDDNVKLLNALAELCRNTGHFRGAAELFSRVLRRREEIGGIQTRETLVSMQDFAAVHMKLKNLHAAKLLYEKSLEGLETISTLDDQTMLSVMNALCDTYVQLKLMREANALALRALPAMRLVLGPDHDLTRATLTHYLEYTTNFDFDEHMVTLIQDYQEHHTDAGLWVLQGLGRAYSLAGLQRDAAKTFKLVWDARTVLQGPQEYATLDALQGRCLALEFMDDIDRATNSYTHLLQLSSRTPPGHEARKRINLTRSRLMSLRQRQNSLEEEKIAWGQQGLGHCFTCKQITNRFCLSCQFYRFCSEECRDRSGYIHQIACHPSVSLCESKSVSTAESVPTRMSQLAVETVQSRDMKLRIRTKVYRVTSSFSLSLDRRRFATFRVKLSSPVDTFLMFERNVDIRYAIVDTTMDFANPRDSVSILSGASRESEHVMPFKWFTPKEQPVLVVPSRRDVYLLVAPGQSMLDAIVAKRQATRLSDSIHWSGMTVPSFDFISYCQGTVVEKKEWERFGYLIEVES